jgi:hAT family C-terminal dimerisation region
MQITTAVGAVCKWMQQSKSSFPCLMFMGRDFTAISALSVPCERVFSSTRLTESKLRARLKDDSIQALCEQNGFIKFLE